MSKEKGRKTLEYYMALSYPFVIHPAEEGGFVAEVEELSGCITQGETLEEVSELIKDASQAWIEVAYESGEEIPLPRSQQEYSGKFIVRLPKSLHRRLAEQAAVEGVSLNQLVVYLLSTELQTQEILNEAKILLGKSPSKIEVPK